MGEMSRRDKFRDNLIHEMMDVGEWEATDTYGNGQIILTDSQSMEFAEWVTDLVASIWDRAHLSGWHDGLYTDPENGRPSYNHYTEEEDPDGI